MSITTRQHNAIAIIIFCALLVFFRLNSGQLQSIETLLAFKADLILQFNGFFDLAPYFSGDGNSQFAMPPMGIWLTALSMKYLGNLPLHLRIPSVLCSAVSLVLMYQIARRILSYQFALIAPVLLASTLVWNSYARQAGADIPAVMFVLISFWCLIKLGEESKLKSNFKKISSKYGLILLYSIGLTGSLLSGFLSGLIAAMMLLPLIPYLKQKALLSCCFGVLTGIFIAGLWYHHVYLNPSAMFSGKITLSQISSLLFASIVAQPFSFIAIITPFLIIINNRKVSTKQKYTSVEFAVLTWSSVSLLLSGLFYSEFFSESSAIVISAPSLIIIALRGYELAGSSSQYSKLMWMILTSLFFAVICSFNQGLIHNIFIASGDLISSILPIIILALIIIIIGFVFPKHRLHQITSRLTFWFIIIIPILLILRIAVINISKPNRMNPKKTEATNLSQKVIVENVG